MALDCSVSSVLCPVIANISYNNLLPKHRPSNRRENISYEENNFLNCIYKFQGQWTWNVFQWEWEGRSMSKHDCIELHWSMPYGDIIMDLSMCE